MKFPYRKINLKHPFSSKPFILRPIIPISLRFNNRSIRYEALIDSGADFNIFPLEIAENLGIKLERGKKIYFSSVSGDALDGVITDLVLELGSTRVETKVVFAQVGNGVLGQYGFFDNFQIKFDLKKKEVEVI